MGKTPSPGKWIKSLLGKKSSKSSLEKGGEKLRSAKKEEVVVRVKDNNVSKLPTEPPVISSEEVADTQTVVVLDVVIPEKQPSGDIEGNEASNVNLESGNDSEEVKLEEAATKVQAAVRAHQAREEFENLKGIIRVQAVIRGHLVRRQAVATYSCIWGIVKLQALVRGKKARSSETGAELQKTNTETENSETLQGTTYSWMETPTKLSMIDKILVSSPTTLPLKIQYNPEDPNSAKVWLERWTHLQVWAPGPLVVKNLIPKSQTKKRSFQAVETEKGKLKRGVRKPSGALVTGNSSNNRSTAENEKPKRTVRKASTLGKELTRIENDKSKQSSRKSTSAIKEGSSVEVKDEKPRISLKKASHSNGIEKATRKSAEKKKEVADSVQKELSVYKVSASVVGAPGDEKINNLVPETVSKESDLDKEDKSPVLDNPEQEELKTAERDDKAEGEIQEPDVQISSENGNVASENGNVASENGNVASENIKPSDRRASLPAKIENHHHDDGLTQSGRKIPSYMAPTASAKARIRGQGSPRIAQEKPEKNGTTRRHSLPPAANGKLNTMSPRAHRLLIASAKGSMNSDRSFSSSKDIGGKRQVDES
ncbi:PREDICTED: protein IQ-DOMAIN 31-like isoform X3 [Camelina sativa]|uniref:Protein IQ-DOMAIN 31-like isoform X3 n=1 Tax=Camelina sativa TaxID=90675 RepID=A0ABM1RT07_CAMSA|nr:PREDICTED: protein IQ-DOMAIN 31-like isoform X3 [Camelina sativa]